MLRLQGRGESHRVGLSICQDKTNDHSDTILKHCCLDKRGLLWVHLNFEEISIGHFGRTRCAPTIGAIINIIVGANCIRPL
ncbi:unknown protein [Microcystis aeruginosa NIES-843]|uniref:Uncharacterized protein n=1 Tax=Microcystis aeruginosa (strain NIES-843 / IAM M-2473) TaxID=449447 RepID=B0JRM4_MICAN|nr:unknown protein [Microcystis aeruginosa NIES-843]